jgi:hypothetical protein
MKTTGVSLQKINIKQERINTNVTIGVSKFKEALYVSYLYLMIPVDKLVIEFFFIKTKRNPAGKDVTFFIDTLLFLTVSVILLVYFELSKSDKNNPFTKGQLNEFTSDKIFIFNAMWHIKDNTLRFDYILGFLVCMT